MMEREHVARLLWHIRRGDVGAWDALVGRVGGAHDLAAAVAMLRAGGRVCWDGDYLKPEGATRAVYMRTKHVPCN